MKKSRKNEIGMIGRSKADMKKGRREKRSVKEKRERPKPSRERVNKAFTLKLYKKTCKKEWQRNEQKKEERKREGEGS